MYNLIYKVESIDWGNRELDARIWAEQDNRHVTQVGNKILATSRTAPNDQCLLGVIDLGEHSRHFECDAYHKPPIPHYTTSLDAKLPWENICSVAVHDVVEGEPLGEIWEAWHIDPETRRRTMGAGQTEALARRAAALKSRWTTVGEDL